VQLKYKQGFGFPFLIKDELNSSNQTKNFAFQKNVNLQMKKYKFVNNNISNLLSLVLRHILALNITRFSHQEIQ